MGAESLALEGGPVRPRPSLLEQGLELRQVAERGEVGVVLDLGEVLEARAAMAFRSVSSAAVTYFCC